MLLFKPDAQGNATEIKKHYSGVQENLSFQTLESYIAQAQDKFIRPMLGDEQTDELINTFQNDTLTAAQEKLLFQVQRTLTYYVFGENFLYLDVFVSDAGTQQANLKENMPIPQWKFRAIVRQLFESADNFAEALLVFLEKNKDDYPLWANSQAYTFANEFLIKSASDFNYFVPIQSSRRVFLRLRPFLRIAERQIIEGLISKEFFEEIKNIPPPNTEIIGLCKSITAYTAFAKCLPTLNLINSAEGFFLTSYNDGVKTESVLDTQTKNALVAQYETYAQMDMQRLKKILDKNPDLYPVYKNSEAYKKPEEKSFGKIIDNGGRKNFVL